MLTNHQSLIPHRLHPIVEELQEHFEKVIRLIIDFSSRLKIDFELTDDALKRFNEIETKLYNDYDDILPFIGRYMEYIVSIADLMYFSDYLYRETDIDSLLDERFEFNDLTDLTYLTNLTKDIAVVKDSIIKLVKRVNRVKSVKLVGNTLGEDLVLNSIGVDKEYINRAYQFIKERLDYVRKLQEYVSLSKPVSKVKSFLNENAPTTKSFIMQRTHLDKYLLERAVETLDLGGQNYLISFARYRKEGGIPQEIYCLKSKISSTACDKCEWKKSCTVNWNNWKE